jgi:L-lactate permease
MEKLLIAAGIGMIAIALIGFLINRPKRKKMVGNIRRTLKAKVEKVEMLGDYLYRATLRLQDGRILNKTVFATEPLNSGDKVVIEPIKSEVWRVFKFKKE